MSSKKIKGINIKIGADTKGLETALKGIENRSKYTKDELFEINRTLKNTPENLTIWKQKQDVLNKSIEESKNKVKLLEYAQEQVAKQLADGKISDEQYKAFQRELENARVESKKLEEQLQNTNKKIDEIGNNAEESSKSVEKASDGYTVFKDVLGNLVTQGINLAIEKVKAFTTAIIETGKAFEASMSNVEAISGATGDELEKLSEKAKQMGATTKYTASQAADAFGYMALAGWKTEDMLAGIDGVLSLAAASNMDLARASDIVTDYLTAFGLTAQDSSKFVDQMSYAMSKSNTTTELLGEAYKNCAATAASMGYSVEETTAVLMTMANAGVKGGEAGTALNAIMTRLATDTKGCATQLAKFGINIYDTQGNMQSLSSILQGVSGVWTTLTDQQQANLAKIIAGTNHYSALQTIMNGLSDSAKESGMSFTDYASALEECDGTAQNMADTMIDNLAGDMTILDSSIDGVKIALSDKLNPIIRDLVQYITEKMPEIQEKAEEIFDSGVDIFEWCKSNIPILLSSVKNFFGVIFKIFPDFSKHLDIIIPLVTNLATGFIAWKSANIAKDAVKGLIPVISKLNTAMLANPAGVVAAGIAALGTAIGLCVVQAATDVSELQKISEEVDKEFSEKTQRIDDIKEKTNDLNKSFYDSANAIDNETRKTKDLWKELHELAGESGKVLDADKKRADYILGELNEALGTEYTMTGNQIDNYKTLSGEIDKVIEKKHAEALLNVALAQSAELLQEQSKAKQEHRIAEEDREKYKLEKKQAEENYETIGEKIGISASDFVNNYGKLFEKGTKSTRHVYENENGDYITTTITAEQYQAAKAVIDANQAYQNASTNERKAYAAWQDISEQLKETFEAQRAFSEGEYKDSINLLLGEYSGFDAENATEDEMLAEYKKNKKQLSSDWILYRDSNNQNDINEYLTDLAANLDLGQRAGVKLDELIDTELFMQLKQLNDKKYNLSAFFSYGKNSGIDITKFFGQDYSEILSAQINNLPKGYNVDDFLEWSALSETKIAKESWDDAANYIQKRLDEGFNVEKLIENGAEAGIDWGKAFNGNYMDIIQKQINNGFDPTKLIESWSEVDEKAAEDFKKNSVDVIQKMLNKGFDPTNLMQWFLDNGVDGTKLFTDEMKKEFEKTDFSGIKMEGLFNHLDKLIEEKAAEEAEIYGKYFTNYINQYKYHKEVESGEMKPNSKWDADLYNGKINYGLNESSDIRDSLNLSKFATGGYISAGNSGIIAEAGPELIEVMNGGVRITPMREKARNTEVSDNTAGQKIFYNTYNLNNPRVSNDMDIRQIAQKLAIEQRRIERGRGIF